MTQTAADVSMSSHHRRLGERLILVGGAPRSGTTLVQNLLDSHPQILGGPEFLHLPEIAAVHDAVRRSAEAGWIDAFGDGAFVNARFAELIENLLLPLADQHDCKYLSEKTPQNVLAFESMLEILPEARFIFVLRDPRAVVSSMLQVGRRASAHDRAVGPAYRSLGASVRFVRNCIAAGRSAESAAPQRVLIVEYEKLVADPEAQTRRMCAFLCLDWTPAMLAPEQQSHPNEAAITNDVWYDKKMFRRAPEASNADKWKKNLTTFQIARLNFAFSNFSPLSDRSYDFSAYPDGGRPGPLTRNTAKVVQMAADSNNLAVKNLLHIWRKLRGRG
jgi:hypothetical protein